MTKKEELEQLKAKIEKAGAFLEQCLDAWHQAGSPDVLRSDLDRARGEANRRLALVREANRDRTIVSLKIAYLKSADFTRKAARRMGSWVVAPMIGGTVFFILAALLGILVTSSLVLTLGLGLVGFLAGALPILCLLFLPADDEVRTRIGALEQQSSEQSEPLDEARLAYQEAQGRYDNLARLHKLQTECERAAIEKQNLEDEYQAACDALSIYRERGH